MDESLGNRMDWKTRDRLVGRLDRMVDAGRLTAEEADRIRAAGQQKEFNDVVRDIRVRHAAASLDSEVADGSLTRDAADDLLERVRNENHSPSLRARLRDLRSGVRAGSPVGAGKAATRNDGGDAHG
ncbi:MAG: hypothetical protein ABIZ34_08100 [Candidatus Limnocylindrales bacterium]